MRSTLATLFVGLAAITSSAAQAATEINTAGFGVTVTDRFWEDSQMTLLSSSGGTTRIGLVGMDATLGIPWEVESDHDMGAFDANWVDTQFAFDVQAGYRITSLTLTGTATGIIRAGVPWGDGMPGSATTTLSHSWSIGQGEPTAQLGSQVIRDLHGEQQLSLTAGVPYAGDFSLLLNSSLAQEVQPGQEGFSNGGVVWHQSFASIALRDVVLTVQVSPVPEPATYAMLLAGLGVAGWAARRRRT